MGLNIIVGWKRRVVLILVMLSAVWTLSWCAARWLIVTAPPDHGDALVMLSGSSSIHERAKRTADLYLKHSASKVIVTNDNQQGGWDAKEQRNPYYYEIAQRDLVRLGVRPSDINLIPNPVNSTQDEAIAVRRFAEDKDIRALVLVTSAYHSRRALRTFRRAFSDSSIIIGSAPAPTGLQTPRTGIWWLSLRGWQVVGGEYIKLLSYELQ